MSFDPLWNHQIVLPHEFRGYCFNKGQSKFPQRSYPWMDVSTDEVRQTPYPSSGRMGIGGSYPPSFIPDEGLGFRSWRHPVGWLPCGSHPMRSEKMVFLPTKNWAQTNKKLHRSPIRFGLTTGGVRTRMSRHIYLYPPDRPDGYR
jgi:hypothetical protein